VACRPPPLVTRACAALAAVEEANEFCRRHGQAAVTDGFYDKSEIGAEGEHTSSILFRCAVPQPLGF
jgi:hypothetical protein